MMRDYFHALAALLQTCLRGAEQYQCWFSGEETDFVRFNRSVIRQPGHVRQSSLNLDLIEGQRHVGVEFGLSGRLDADRALIERMIEQLRAQLPDLPEDPYLLLATEVHSSESGETSRLPSAHAIVDEVLQAARGYDLVGILAAGPVYRGFANSLGQRNWHASASFNLDWSLYQTRDKAVKSSYAGFEWSSAEFAAKFALATAQLDTLKRAPVTVPPGGYRAYLTPTALNEMVGMLNWAGLSEKSLRTKQSSLRRMRDEGLRFHPSVTLRENTAGGLAPGFQAEGFIKPAEVLLIDGGKLAGSMISPRSAREYGIAANGANADESAGSLDLAGGDLPMGEVLAHLGTGIFVSNLWYLNFSDRSSCRLTGMTRFATFWVEDGVIQAPLNVMRFDDSLFRVLGENLLGLTRERELLIDNSSYGGRGTDSARLPGALVREFMFVS
jgi:predicted Zn-dependent protease